MVVSGEICGYFYSSELYNILIFIFAKKISGCITQKLTDLFNDAFMYYGIELLFLVLLCRVNASLEDRY